MRLLIYRSIVLMQNLLFWPLFFTATLIYTLLAGVCVTVLSLPLSRRATLRVVRRAISYYGRVVIGCAWPFVRVQYVDMKPEEKDGPFIFVCNHRSASDPFLMAFLPYEAIQIVKQWPFKLPLLGFMARVAGYLSIHDMPLESFFETAGKRYGEGVCLVSFPEGTRSGSRNMGQFTSSIFRLAIRLKARVVPVAITGNENIPKKGSLKLRPGTVRVHKLPAIDAEECEHMSAFSLKNHVRALLQNHMDTIES